MEAGFYRRAEHRLDFRVEPRALPEPYDHFSVNGIQAVKLVPSEVPST